MLVAFIGGPCSGKTTIAVKMFVNFKELATNTELIIEQARLYIAEQRVAGNLNPDEIVNLTNDDQMKILKRQNAAEKAMKHSCGKNTIIISDSCTLNSILYMSKDIESNGVTELIKTVSPNYDLLMYCHTMDLRFLPTDPNRVHNLEAIQALKSRTDAIVNAVRTNTNVPVIDLIGAHTLETKYRDACSQTLARHHDILTRV